MAIRIGIMGGTFNPIHNAHLMLARCAYEQFKLDKIIFIPSGTPAYKDLSSVAEAKHRYEMTKLAIEDIPDFEISDIDINRKGNTYTVDTLIQLSKKNKNEQIYFIIGGDSLFAFENWHKPKEILNYCKIIAAGRGIYKKEEVLKKIDELNHRYNTEIGFLNIPAMDISSSGIRKLIGEGSSFRQYVPQKVYEYIVMNKLYKNNKEVLNG